MYIFGLPFLGFGKPSDSLQVPSRASAIPPKLPRLHFSQNVKTYPLGIAELDRTKSTAKMTTRTITAGARTERSQVHTDTTDPNKWTKIQKMILALEELHKTFNSTLSSQLAIISRGNNTFVLQIDCLFYNEYIFIHFFWEPQVNFSQ